MIRQTEIRRQDNINPALLIWIGVLYLVIKPPPILQLTKVLKGGKNGLLLTQTPAITDKPYY